MPTTLPLSIGDHCADVGIGRGQADALARKFQRAVQVLFVSGVSRHSGRIYHDATTADPYDRLSHPRRSLGRTFSLTLHRRKVRARAT